MAQWQDITRQLREQAAKVPKLLWAAMGVVGISLAVVVWLESSGPPYAVLSEGLAPADGGKVIAQLQKLGIPYQLQAAGNVILVPTPQLAQARLQLGAAQIPGNSSQTAWSQLENAPMTASDLAQSTMATQALETSLEQSIEAMNGVRDAQVFLALPPETPFLADQPHASASIVLDADQAQAAAQAKAIADLVAGAVPGLSAANVTVVTTSGITVYPVSGSMNTGRQFATIEQIETSTAARVAGLLAPIVGSGNFRTDVSADLDFTQTSIRQISYGPTHLVEHSNSTQSSQTGADTGAIGIPGALSNEPPPATTAGTPPTTSTTPPTATADKSSAAGTNKSTSTDKTASAAPTRTASSLEQSFVTDQTDSSITKPDWAVKSVAISVVVNESALPKGITISALQNAIASGLAYPNVKVNVLATPFDKTAPSTLGGTHLANFMSPITRATLELLAAMALLFGLALPLGRRLATLTFKSVLPQPPQSLVHELPPAKPRQDFSNVRDQAKQNIAGVASLLQNWVEEND